MKNLYECEYMGYHGDGSILMVADSEDEARERAWKKIDGQAYRMWVYLVDEVDGYIVELKEKVV